jgi:prepilin-type N-terminal cleavage/methylation domain-containing protein
MKTTRHRASRRPRPRLRARAGFSLAELLVATVLLGIVGGALTRLVVDQMRFFDNVQVARGARSAARGSMNIMLSELRMVQDSGGVTAIGNDDKSITVNVPYRFGMYCATTGTVSTVSMLPADSAALALASFAGYGWRGRTSGRYTIVSGASVGASATASKCTGTGAGEAGIATVTINGRAGEVLDVTPAIPAGTAPGMPVMFYQTVTYSFANSSLYPGKIGLYRSVNGGTAEELMAPFASDARFRYYKAGDDTSRTTAPALSDIRGVALVLTSEGARLPAGRTSYAQAKVVTAIFFKNTRAP